MQKTAKNGTKKGLCGAKSSFYSCGAACQSRTDMPSRAADFESTASTISPRRHFFFAKVPPCVTISYSYANENTRKRLRSICLPTSKARIEDYNPSREETVITFTIDLC